MTQIPTQQKQASSITFPKSSHSASLTETTDQEATGTPEKEFRIPRGALLNCTNDVASTTLSSEEDGLWCAMLPARLLGSQHPVRCWQGFTQVLYKPLLELHTSHVTSPAERPLDVAFLPQPLSWASSRAAGHTHLGGEPLTALSVSTRYCSRWPELKGLLGASNTGNFAFIHLKASLVFLRIEFILRW